MFTRVLSSPNQKGGLIRDIQRKPTDIDKELAILPARADRIRCQRPKDKNELYGLHETEVQCISKGKAQKRYEFGWKIVAAALMENNPYD